MNSVKTWLTKEEVLKDLAKVSGRRVARVGNLDESYLIVGNAPPPVKFEGEDDEMMQQFGGVIREKGVHCEIAPPDLQGITDMIRMVQESDAESDCEDITNTTPNSNCVIAISKSTQLNPNVKPFIPNGASSSQSSSDISETTSPKDNKTEDKTEDKGKKSISCEVISKDLDKCEDLATTLKKNISDASKADSFERKKQNNVAIASLLRLYATNNNNKSTKTLNDTEPVKLVTPDFYDHKRSPTKELEVVCPKSTSTTPVPKSNLSSNLSLSSNEAKSEPMLRTRCKAASPVKPKLDPAVKQSIEKVNQWMGEPVQKKKPVVFLEPITFKKKEPTTSNTTSKLPSLSDTEQTQVKKPSQPTQYRPSSYAADLGREYMERSKTKESKKVNPWDDLYVILKEKETSMKKKLAQANDTRDLEAP